MYIYIYMCVCVCRHVLRPPNLWMHRIAREEFAEIMPAEVLADPKRGHLTRIVRHGLCSAKLCLPIVSDVKAKIQGP